MRGERNTLVSTTFACKTKLI